MSGRSGRSRWGVTCWRVTTVTILVVGIAVLPVAAQDRWVAPAETKAKQNPVRRATGTKDGKAAYETNCATCHGPRGKGDGPVAASLNPRPRNLGDKAIQEQTDGELFWKISEGRGPMAPWKHLDEKTRWSLVHYIRSFAAKN